jgi:hypothetical protein
MSVVPVDIAEEVEWLQVRNKGEGRVTKSVGIYQTYITFTFGAISLYGRYGRIGVYDRGRVALEA